MGNAHYDLIVIGGGSAGLTAATIGARVGAKVLLVDKESLGGDCLHYGCVPSKALIASARMAHRMRNAAEYGIQPVDVAVDFKKVMKRVWDIKADIGQHETPETFRTLGADVMLGGARFVDELTLEIGGRQRVTTDKIIIATGSKASPPPIPGLAESGFIDHVALFHLETLPKRLVVIGGGPVGCEMGQALSRLGSEVTIVQKASRLLPREDAQVSELLQARFREEGMQLLLSSAASKISVADSEKKVFVQRGHDEIVVDCDEILVAVGRRAVVADLDLAAAGIETNDRGILVNDRLQTNISHIYAVGDCNGGPQFTHWAEYEARIAVRNALFRGSSKRSMAIIPWVTFTDPEIARVGLTFDEAIQHIPENDVHIHQVPLSKVDRAVCEGESQGFIKVVVGAKDRILGVSVIGIEAGEALSEWVLAMEHHISLADIGNAIHAYPTLGRVNRRVADDRFMTHGISRWTTRLFGQFKARDSEEHG